MFISLNISSKFANLSMDKKGLSLGELSDNVLHKLEVSGLSCNTLSEGQYDNDFTTKTTFDFPFYKNTLLDDQTPGGQNAILHSIGSPFSGRNRVLQQFYSQRWLVHPSFDTTIRKKRIMVLPRYRLFPLRNRYLLFL